MLPNLYWTTIHLGPIPIQVWGLFVASGILVAMLVAKRRANRLGLSGDLILDGGFWVVLAGIVGARVFFILTNISLFTDSWLDIFKVWEGGMSIMGSLLAGGVTGYLYFRKHAPGQLWQYVDVVAWVLPLGLAIGRIGCFFVFDHPGSVTNFFLGEVYYGDGLVHHNHGLYLVLNAAAMFLVFLWLDMKKWAGNNPTTFMYLPIVLLWDGIYRFLADFDRISDPTYAGLKAAQWIGLVMILCGLYVVLRKQKVQKNQQ